jgi:hypothetical protein
MRDRIELDLGKKDIQRVDKITDGCYDIKLFQLF